MRGKQKGFSRAEIIIVSVLVTILAAIILPIFYRQRMSPILRRSCMSNAKQQGLAFMAYCQDYDQKFPPAGQTQPLDNGWARVLLPYSRNSKLLKCPADSVFVQDESPGSRSFTNYYFNAQLAGESAAMLKHPAKVILLAEGQAASSNYACRSYDKCKGLSPQGAVGPVPEEGKGRHGGTSSFLFADGHMYVLPPSKVAKRLSKEIYFSFEP